MQDMYVGLLRGINVGGNHQLPMQELRPMFVSAGCGDVRTYIQSGNVLFRATKGVAAGLPSAISTAIEQRFGFPAPLLLRSREQLRAVVQNNPYLEAGENTGKLYVLFLADLPSVQRVESLDPRRSPVDTFAVRGQEVYLRYAEGSARSTLTNAYFDAKLATISTARNWRTVTTLLTLLE